MRPTLRLLSRLRADKSALFLCDMQEKFRPTVHKFESVVAIARRMHDAANVIGLPVVVTEQYPKGLGRTVDELGVDRETMQIYEKTCFSMILPEVKDRLRELKTEQVILCGIEAHACIYHTTYDLLKAGLEVHIVCDAVSSRSNTERMFALRQLEKAGATLTTSECAILSLVRDAAHPKFKLIQKIIMQSAPETGLLTGV